MENLSIIIPINKLDDDLTVRFVKAVESAKTEKIIVVGPQEVVDTVSKMTLPCPVKTLLNTDGSDMATQINFAVEHIDTEWFSVLEADDVFVDIWFANVEKYAKNHPEVSIFLPLSELVDPQGKELGFINEAVWATAFSDDLGVLNLDALSNYPNFNLTGAVINTAKFKEVGKLKPSIKFMFIYEFMLRFEYNSNVIMTVPKLGYLHTINREGSLMVEYGKTMTEHEMKWWNKLAKTEYYFKEDRKKEYVKPENETESNKETAIDKAAIDKVD